MITVNKKKEELPVIKADKKKKEKKGAVAALTGSIYWRQRYLLLMLLPALAYFVIFHYIPLYGVTIAFKDYKFTEGILGSAWVGLKHFRRLFALESFWQVFKNTLVISLWKFLVGFPAPIIFSLILNEVISSKFKKCVQTISYLPHFVSWVVLGGILTQLLSPSTGPVNIIIKALGFDPIYFLADSRYFRGVLVVSHVWKSIGWGSIVYLAALTTSDQQVHEAAMVDGANRFQRIIHITIPEIMPVITIMLILAVGGLINDDFDQVFNLYNTAVYDVGDVLSTYTYRAGLVNLEYSFATAVGLFKNIISVILVLSTNMICRKINDYGIW